MLVYYIACYSQITVFSAVYFTLLFTNHRLQCCLFCPVIHKSLFYVLSILPCFSQCTVFRAVYFAPFSQFTLFHAVYFPLLFIIHCLLCCLLCPVIHNSLSHVLSIMPCHSHITVFCVVIMPCFSQVIVSYAVNFATLLLDVMPSTAPVLVLCCTETTRRAVPGSHHSYKMLTTRKQLCSIVGRMAWPATPWLPLT